MKILTAFILLYGSLLLLGCGDDDAPPPTPTALAITPSSVPELPVGGTQTFTATGTSTDGSTYDATLYSSWVSSDTNVATIDALGVATTKAVGTANISATSAGINSNSVGLTVETDPVPPPTETTDYSLDNVCRAEFCAVDATLAQKCQDFVNSCLAQAGDLSDDECIATGLVICRNPDADAGGVCDYEACGTDPALNQECEAFMTNCLAISVSDDECVGAALLKCRF